MNCPICNKNLSQMLGAYQEYYCPVTTPNLINGGNRFHYYWYPNEQEYFYVGQYRIFKYKGSYIFYIYKCVPLEVGSIKGYYYKMVLEVPEFKIKSEEQLLNKLQLLTVFS